MGPEVQFILREGAQLVLIGLVPILFVAMLVGVVVTIIEKFAGVADTGLATCARCAGALGAALLTYPLVAPRLVSLARTAWGGG